MAQQPQFDLKEILKNEYSSKQSWFELKQAASRSKSQMPLFTKCLLVTRFVLYWVSWFTSAPNDFMRNDPDLTYGSFQYWRLLFCPLIVTSFFGDILFTMPIYLCFFCYIREYHTGTAAAYLFFNGVNIVIQVTSYLICLLLSSTISSQTDVDLFPQDTAFFNLLVAELMLAMLRNPNKPIDLLFCTVPQKAFVFVALAFVHFVFSYDWISITSVVLVGLSLHLLAQLDMMSIVVSKIESALRCANACMNLGYITADVGKMNKLQSSDDLVAFNRREIRGHVRDDPGFRQRCAARQQQSLFTNGGSTAAQAALSSSASQGVQLGGGPGSLGGSTSSRSESKLLQMRRPASTPEKPSQHPDRSMDEDELLESQD